MMFPTDDPELDALAASVWANTPRPMIPANWRELGKESVPKMFREFHYHDNVARIRSKVRKPKSPLYASREQWMRTRLG